MWVERGTATKQNGAEDIMTAPSRGGWEGCHVLCVGVCCVWCIVIAKSCLLPLCFWFFFSLFLSFFTRDGNPV